MKKIIWFGVLLLLSMPAYAEEISVHVRGMVCGFCAQGIEKKFKAEKSVVEIDVSLKKKMVRLTTAPDENLDDERIREILKESGYDVEKIERQ